MQIAVGSLNPLKVEAVRNIAARAFGEVTVQGVEVDSGVGRNPLTDAETLAGAVTRAGAAKEATGADLGVGIEGGLTEVGGKCFTSVWCAVATASGVLTGGGVHILVPREVLLMITRDRMEMGDVMDRLTARTDTKRTTGFEGIVTQGLIGRRESFEAVIAYTLAPLLSPDLYR